jgi:hypothetical protein
MVGRWAHGLSWVGRWVLRRVRYCWHPWLRGHGVIALICWSRVARWYTRRLWVRSVHHSGGCGGGHNSCKENSSQDPPSPQVLRPGLFPSLELSQSRVLLSSPCPPRGLYLHTREGGPQQDRVGEVCLRRGRRHILYKQQQEQVKQMMMVTTESTKIVSPMATVAPNLSKSQS